MKSCIPVCKVCMTCRSEGANIITPLPQITASPYLSWHHKMFKKNTHKKIPSAVKLPLVSSFDNDTNRQGEANGFRIGTFIKIGICCETK